MSAETTTGGRRWMRGAHLCNLVLQNTARVSLKTAANVTNSLPARNSCSDYVYTHTLCIVALMSGPVVVYYSFAGLETCAQNCKKRKYADELVVRFFLLSGFTLRSFLVSSPAYRDSVPLIWFSLSRGLHDDLKCLHSGTGVINRSSKFGIRR